MIHLDFNDGFTRMEKALIAFGGKQLPFATAQALNDSARAARDAVNKAMPSVFDRPTPFTDNAAVAPKELAATKDRLAATVTLRPIQGKYLALEEAGGARDPGANTRKPAKALVLPGKLDLDQYGNLSSGTLRSLKGQVASQARQVRRLKVATSKAAKRGEAPPARLDQTGTVAFLPAGARGNLAGVGGYFRRLAGHKLTRLTAFEASTHYTARMGYHDRVAAVVRATWPLAMIKRLREAIATAR